MADWTDDIIDIGDAINVSTSLAVSILRSKWRLAMCAVTCQYVGSHLDHGETVLEFRWAIKSLTGNVECEDTVVLGLELVAKESVHVPPGLHVFLEERDHPRRVAIEAALAAQSLAAKTTGKRIGCQYRGQALGEGLYGVSPLDWTMRQSRGKLDITNTMLSFRWRVWTGRASESFISEEISVAYKNVATDGVTFPRRFQFASKVAKRLPQCACDSVKRLGASFTEAVHVTCEVLGVPKQEQQGAAGSSASSVCLDSAALREVEAFEANPWLWPSAMQHSNVRVFVCWSAFVRGSGLRKYFTAAAALKNVLERGYFPAPDDFRKGLFFEASQLCAPAASKALQGHPAATCSESCSEDATDDETAPAAKVARMGEITDGGIAFKAEACTRAGVPALSGEESKQPPAVFAKSEAGGSNDDFCGLDNEDVDELRKSDAERKWEEIELKARWGEPDRPPWIVQALQEEAEDNRPLNCTHLTRNALRRLQRMVRMDRKSLAVVRLMIDRHRRRAWQTTPQEVLEVFQALPDGFAREAGIPMEEIKELAQTQTVESLGDEVRRKLRMWQECAKLFVNR